MAGPVSVRRVRSVHPRDHECHKWDESHELSTFRKACSKEGARPRTWSFLTSMGLALFVPFVGDLPSCSRGGAAAARGRYADPRPLPSWGLHADQVACRRSRAQCVPKDQRLILRCAESAYGRRNQDFHRIDRHPDWTHVLTGTTPLGACPVYRRYHPEGTSYP